MNAMFPTHRDFTPAAVPEGMECVEWNGRIYPLPYANLFRKLSEQERVSLRDDINKRGVQVAVMLDHRGWVIDGGNRLEIAAELNLPMHRVKIEPCLGLSDEQCEELAKVLNLHRRHLSREERDAEVLRLLAVGTLNNVAIAHVVGTNEQHVRRLRARQDEETAGSSNDEPAPKKPPDKVPDARGRLQPVQRLAREDKKARQDRVLKATEQGVLTADQIANAEGISRRMYFEDLKAARARRITPTEASGEESQSSSMDEEAGPAAARGAEAEAGDTSSPSWHELEVRNPETKRRDNVATAIALDAAGYPLPRIAEVLNLKPETVSDYLVNANPAPKCGDGSIDPGEAVRRARESAELSRPDWLKALVKHLIGVRRAQDFAERCGDLESAKTAIRDASKILGSVLEKLENYEEEGIE